MAADTHPLSAEQRAAPVVGIIYNARSHRNRGRDLEIAARPNVHFAQPHAHEEITAALADFARHGIDFLIINGGDGTVRDVLTCGEAVFAGDWPELAVLPKGKTNALNVDLGAPSGYNLADAFDAFPGGKRVVRRPLLVEPVSSEANTGQASRMLGFILGAGGYALGVRAGQDAHKLGAFNSLAVGFASAWGLLQALFGTDRNVWRGGVGLEILLDDMREPLPHNGFGDPNRRMVMLASTLERFPVGIKLFGKLRSGLKLMVMDKPRRRLLAMMPAILAGYTPRWVCRAGIHQIETKSFEFAIDDVFILDGEAFPKGRYRVSSGPELSFVVP